MASNTDKFNLLKKDPATDGSDTFNIETMLNENWDKLDSEAQKQIPVSDIEPTDPVSDPLWIDTSGDTPVLKQHDGTTYQSVGEVTQQELDNHTSNNSNPHNVTASQVGAPTQTEHDNLSDTVTSHQADDEIHHTHNNKTTLDSLSDDGSGGLRYKGTSVGEVSQTEFDNHTNNSDIHKTSSEIRGEASTKIVLETRTTDPSTPELGRIWVRSDL